MIFYYTMDTTAPERPVGNPTYSATYVTTEVDQFYSDYLAAGRDVETAILAIPCAKTYRTEICFDPGIWKEKK